MDYDSPAEAPSPLDRCTRLTAHRSDDEPSRFIRLAKALGILEYLTKQSEIPLAMHDHKGRLVVHWRSHNDFETFAGVIGQAWLWLDGESAIVEHYVNGVVVTGEQAFGKTAFPGDSYPDCLTLLRWGTLKWPGGAQDG